MRRSVLIAVLFAGALTACTDDNPNYGTLEAGNGDVGGIGHCEDGGTGTPDPDGATPPDATLPHEPDLISNTCAPSLSNIGAGGFTIRFRITTTSTTKAELLFQRAMCGHGTFWNTVMSGSGDIYVETDDGVSYTYFGSTTAVNDGQPHDVVVQRKASVLALLIDGALSGSAASHADLGKLPPLGIGSGDPCGSPPLTTGAITNVCLLRY